MICRKFFFLVAGCSIVRYLDFEKVIVTDVWRIDKEMSYCLEYLSIAKMNCIFDRIQLLIFVNELLHQQENDVKS